MSQHAGRRRALDAGLILFAVGIEGMLGARQGPFQRWEAPYWAVLLAFVVLYLPLFWRRRYPLAVLAWMVVLSYLHLVGPHWPFVGLFIALFSVGRWAPAGLSVRGTTAVLIVAGAIGTSLENRNEDLWQTILVWLVMCVGVWMAGWSLQLAETQRLQQRAALLEAARRRRHQERLALARELHDNVAGSISAIVVQAAGAKALKDRGDPRAEAALDVIAHTGTVAVEQMQRLLNLLRAEDDSVELIITESETYADLPELVQEAERRGLQVRLHTDGEPHGVTPGVSAATYRVVQESLTNALKHAGSGSVVDIDVQWRPEDVEVQVRSRAGEVEVPDLPSTGFGLAGLGERIRLVGGTFSFQQDSDAFVTTARLPLRPGEGEKP